MRGARTTMQHRATRALEGRLCWIGVACVVPPVAGCDMNVGIGDGPPVYQQGPSPCPREPIPYGTRSTGCDDWNAINGDGCSASCQVEPGWTCRQRYGLQPLPDECDPVPCGNGSPDPDEECDDGNVTDGDGCTASCTIEDWVCTEVAA